MKSVSFQSTSRDSSARFPAPAAEVERLTPSNGTLSTNIGSTTVGAPKKRRPSKPTGLEKWLLRHLLAAIGNPPVVAVLWSGEEVTGGPSGSKPSPDSIRFRLNDRGTLWRILVDPFFQFPEAYCDGRLDIRRRFGDTDRPSSRESAAHSPQGTRLLTYAANLLHWGGRNTLAGSQKNIQHHYDIGNDFYRLWLDETCFTLVRTSRSRPRLSNRRNARRWTTSAASSSCAPGETVIEAGCGWGGFALHMAKHYGVRVRAYNISREQVAEARHRAKAEGLDDRVEFVLEDWRKITGTCDVFVSIGMLEHVGTANYRRLGDVIDRCLAAERPRTDPHHRPQPAPAVGSRGSSGGSFRARIPRRSEQMTAIFEPREFSMLDVENIRLHYAETLRHWLSRYEQSIETIRGMYDERFVRMWRMYLAGSVAAFECGSLQLFQVLFARP